MSKQNARIHRGILIISLILWALHLLGWLFPEYLWTTHFLAFLPLPLSLVFLLAPLALILLNYFQPNLSLPSLPSLGKPTSRWIWIVGLAVFMGFLYHQFPIHTDVYGDSDRFREHMGEETLESSPKRIHYIFRLNVLYGKNGEATFINGIQELSALTQAKHATIFRWIDTLFGALFIAIWVGFVGVYTKRAESRLALLCMGILAPFSLFFFGHIEIYAPSYMILSLFCMLCLLYGKFEKALYLWLMLPVAFLCIKFHSVFFMLLPSLGLVFAIHYFPDKVAPYLSWKKLLRIFFFPSYFMGIFFYFVVLKDHQDPRFLASDILPADRLFLPIFTPDPPYDHYTLFHPAHILDFAQMMLFTAFPAMLIGLFALLFGRKQINWSSPMMILLATPLMLILSLLFMINPLLSMPLDWDLYCLIGPLFLFLVVYLIEQMEWEWVKPLQLPIIALSLLSLPLFLLHQQRIPLANRLITTGKYIYKTNWAFGGEAIRDGLEMIREVDEDAYVARNEQLIAELELFALKGADREYSQLVWEFAKYYRKKKFAEEAFRYHEAAYVYDTTSMVNMLGATEACFLAQEYERALFYAKKLVKDGYPTKDKALRVAIHSSIAANRLEQTKTYCEALLADDPQNEFINRLYQALLEGKSQEELFRYFQ